MRIAKYIFLLALFLALGLGSGQAFRAGMDWWNSRPQVSSIDRSALAIPKEPALIMISLSTCPVCVRSKEWLHAEQIPYKEFVVDQSDDAKALAERLNVDSVPTFIVRDIRVTGFDPDSFKQLLETQKIYATAKLAAR